MAATFLDGKPAAEAVLDEVRERAAALSRPPVLATILVGDDPASQTYIRSKRRRASESGISSVHHDLPADSSQAEVAEMIKSLNEDRQVDGILLQLPLPGALDGPAATALIDPAKDADGLHPANLGALVMDRPGLVPCTPAGCLRLLDFYGIPTRGAETVVVGRSFLVGRPLALLLAARGTDATVTIAHSRTEDLAAATRRADIVVAAAGSPGMITADHIRPGAVVIDVGINRLPDGALVGDADASVAEKASALTPVPGGVGPMTVAMLMRNTVQAAESRTL